MPVDTLHPDYTVHAADWVLMRDVVRGHKAIQAKGEAYLKKLSDQTPEEYTAYKTRATFFNATGRVVDTMLGMVFRKDPVFENDTSLKPILEDMTLSGVPFSAFAQDVVKECLEVNRAGVLVDHPTVQLPDKTVVTIELAQRLGLRVYATKYGAEDIINWRTTQVGGKTVLSMLVLRECVEEVNAKDKYTVDSILQYRVLILDGKTYRQEIYRPVTSTNGKKVTTALQLWKEFTPLKNGKPLDSIPFTFFSAKGNETPVEDPLHLDLAYVNLAHYRNDADMEHGLHFTGLPTAVLTGVSDSDSTYRIGSAVAWTFSNDKAKAEFLEFKGEGLGQLRTAKKDKEEQMAALGARMLAPEKKDAEAADAIAQKRQGENSSLGGLANSVSRGLTRVLQIMADWDGKDSKVTVKLNTDYLPAGMVPQQLTALLQAVVSGNLSQQSFYEALVKGEVISGARTYEEEQTLIAEDLANRPDPANDNSEPPARREAA